MKPTASIPPALLALAAVGLWSTLAIGGVLLRHLPPFLLLGITLSISGLSALAYRGALKTPPLVLLVGVGGIFGYHFLYFRAFALAPAVEANLINYLWPLLIVLLSPLLLPGCRLSARHILGAALGMSGAFLILSGGRVSLQSQYLEGYLLALGAALVWAVYSLLTKRLPRFPTGAVSLFCAVSGVLALLVHFSLFHQPGNPPVLRGGEWLLLAWMGIAPMGVAFFAWDAALKRGDPRVIGALAYLTPLLSTVNLMLFAGQRINELTLLAMGLILAGSWISSRPPRRAPAANPS
ncbi:MAG: DMT family transporter [Chloroflexota bacterium]|jgi:drug/metabolite transporter (DMT)-like permease